MAFSIKSIDFGGTKWFLTNERKPIYWGGLMQYFHTFDAVAFANF